MNLFVSGKYSGFFKDTKKAAGACTIEKKNIPFSFPL